MELKKIEVNAEISNSSHNEVETPKIPIKTQLLLKGIAFAENEDLQSIFTTVATEIEYFLINPLRFPELQRQTFIENGTKTPTNTIIMNFTNRSHKQRFSSQFVHKYPFRKEFLNAINAKRLSIRENLTEENQTIMSKCVKYKKEKKIAAVYSNDGIVYIKFKKGGKEPKYPIRSIEGLEFCIKTYGRQ